MYDEREIERAAKAEESRELDKYYKATDNFIEQRYGVVMQVW